MNQYELLSFPEVTYTLNKHLENADRLTCIRVCQQWHDIFAPFLWAEIDLNILYSHLMETNGTEDLDSLKEILENAFERYGMFVRVISSYVTASKEHTKDQTWCFLTGNLVVRHCRRLNRALVLVTSFKEQVVCEALQPLLRNNPTLTHLEITSVSSPPRVMMSDVLVHTPALRHLTWKFYACKPHAKMLALVFVACPKLETFQVEVSRGFKEGITDSILTDNNNNNNIPEHLLARQMRRLKIQAGNQAGFLASAMRACPYLTHLHIEDDDCSVMELASAMAHAPSMMTSLALSYLKTTTTNTTTPPVATLGQFGQENQGLGESNNNSGNSGDVDDSPSNSSSVPLGDEQLATIVRAIPRHQLKELYLRGITYGERTQHALRECQNQFDWRTLDQHKLNLWN